MHKAVEIALSEVGYLEKASNKDLDPKVGSNVGYNNWTKYGRDLDALGDFYNNAKNGFPYCEVFVDWCCYKAYGEDLALKVLCQPRKSAGAGCTQSAEYYKRAGRWFTSNPEEGDQIYFSFSGNGEMDHTGLVWKVTDTYVYTVEGNTSGGSDVVPNGGGVFRKQYARSNWRIAGYGRPRYSLAETADKDPVPPVKPSKDGEVEVVTKEIKMGDSGAEVRTLQAILIKKFNISCGIYGADGDWGNSTQKAFLQFQNRMGLVPDGICGKLSWDALINK